MKNFYKLSVAKIIIFVLLIILTAFIPHTAKICSMAPSGIVCGTNPTQGIGYPAFYGEQFGGDVGYMSFNPIYLVVNIVIFYSVASLVVFGFKKLTRKTQV